MFYFAYGSNMLASRLRSRVADARSVGRGRLGSWSVSFDKRSVDGSAKCTIRPFEDGEVCGAVFEIDETALGELDAVEGPGYRRVPVVIRAGGRSLDAFTYAAESSWIDGTLRPYDWYVDYVLEGAAAMGLSRAYVESELSVAGVSDPDTRRAATHRALLQRWLKRTE